MAEYGYNKGIGKLEVIQMMKIAIDAMSGDLGSSIVVKAVQAFLKQFNDTELYVCGKKEELTELEGLDHVQIIDSRDVISMNDSIMTIRRKKEASMYKAVNLCKEEVCEAVVSAGSTGGFYASAMFFLKRIEGVDKCGLLSTIPTKNGKGVCMCDMGANAENTASQLNDFAVMGTCFLEAVKGVKNPKVALLNIGAEEKKGNEMHIEAYQLLKANPNINFVGNIEGREILEGEVDLIVTDGFSGNIALKTIEGSGKVMMEMLKEVLMSNTRSKIAAMLAKPALRILKNKMDSNQVGGAFMAGFEKPIIKAHGSSNEVAFENAMKMARSMVKENSIEKMKAGLIKNEA